MRYAHRYIWHICFICLAIAAVADAAAQEIDVTGNGVSIVNGDSSPDAADHTDFGAQDVASGQISRTFTIENPGTGLLTLGANAVSVSGVGSIDFTISSQPASSVGSGSSTTFTVQFDPSRGGYREATVTIANDDADESPYGFAIQGTGFTEGVGPRFDILGTVEINDSTVNGPGLDDGDWYGFSIASPGDLDGDKVSDIAVGALGNDGGGSDRGAVHISFLNADGSVKNTAEINDSTPNGPSLISGDYYGRSIASLGDLDGDGVSDIAVGAFFDDAGGTNRGAVHISFLNSDGSVKNTVEINDSTANGPSLATNDNYGTSIASLGDLDGDGVVDIAVGARGDDAGGTKRGAVHISFLNSDGSVKNTVEINDSTANGPSLADNDRYGISIASPGDLDGDGVSDIAVGAFFDDAGGTNRGAVHISFLNSDGSVKNTVEINDSTANGPSLADNDNYGTSIASLGDLDGDGVVDIAVGAREDDAGGTKRGAVHISFLNSDGSVKNTVEINDSTANGPSLADNDRYGTSIASPGDLDGNGFNDLVVGAYYDDEGGPDRGAVHLHFLAPPGPEIEVSGNGQQINNGDTTPSLADHTDYGTLDLDSGQLTRTFVIRNLGALDLSLGPDAGSLSGPAAADFSITSQPGEVVAQSGGLTTISVSFDPSAVGTRSATLSIANDDPDESPYTFDLLGAGANQPDIEVSGNSVAIANGDLIPSAGDNTDFGKLAVGGGVLSKTFSIENLGAIADLTLGANAVSLSGSQSADFTVTTQPTSTIAASGSSSFVIEFDASIVGPREALVTIANNDPDESPFTFKIQGRGVNANDPGLGADAFLQGRYVQFALAANGALGSNSPVPAEGGPFGAYYPRPDANSTGTGDGTLAARSDRGRDGWTVGLPDVGVGGGSDGDFFLPGAREEGFCVTHDPAGDGSALTHWCNNRRDNRTDIPGQLEGTAHSQASSSVDWNGAIANGSASGLQVEQTFRVDDYGSGLAVDVTLTNTTGADINDLYFMRNGDIDNNAPLTGLYWNTLQVFKQFPFDNEAVVFGTQADGSYAELRSSDPDARVSYGGFSNRDSYAVYNNSGPNLFQSGVFDQDWSISIAKYFPVIPPGESRSFSFGYGFIPAPPRVSLVHSGHGLFENNQEHVPESRHFKVRLSEVAAGDVTVNLAFSGTASGSDYFLTPGTNGVSSSQVVIPAGQLEAEIRVDQTDDVDVEGDEYIRVSIANVSGAEVEDGTVDLVIFDDDGECGSDGDLYFSLEADGSFIRRSDLKTGTNAKRAVPSQVLSPTISDAFLSGMFAVSKTQKMFFIASNGSSANSSEISSFGFTDNTVNTISNLPQVRDMTFDEAAGKLLYSWNDVANSMSGISCLGSGTAYSTGSTILDIAVDSSNGALYWHEFSSMYILNKIGFDAASCTAIGQPSAISSGFFLSSSAGLEIDLESQRLYSFSNSGDIAYRDADGANADSHDLSGDLNLGGFALNPQSDRVMWLGRYLQPSRKLFNAPAEFIGTVRELAPADGNFYVQGAACFSSSPGISVSPQRTADSTPVITGTVDEPAATISVSVDGNTYAGVNNGDGSWYLPNNTISPALADGTYDVAATATSGALSASDNTVDELIIDSAAQSPVPGRPDLLTELDSGHSATDNYTNGDHLRFEVSCLDGSVVELLHHSQPVDSGICLGTSIQLSYSPPVDGKYVFKARQSVGSGTPSYSNGALEVTVDRLAPTAPVLGKLTPNPSFYGDDDYVTKFTGVSAIQGTGEPLSIVRFRSPLGNITVGSPVSAAGIWAGVIPSGLSDGTYPFRAYATDVAGNESADSVNLPLVIDTVLPATPTVNALTTTDATPVISGTYDNADVEFFVIGVSNGNGNYVNGIDPELTVVGDSWQLAISTPLAVGTYDVSILTIDLAGNQSLDTTTDELQITSGGGIGFDGSACSGADSDGDGVPDECDNCIADKNPLQRDSNRDGLGDRCDATNLIPFSPAYVKWNTYIRQWNFLELIAQGENALEVKVTVLNLLGQELIQTVVNVPAGSEMDVDINQLLRTACTDDNGPNCNGFSDADGDGLIDSYGLVKVEFDNSEVSTRLVGRLTNYRPDPAGQPGVEGQSFSFALTRELRPPSRGATYALANTFDPQGLGYMVPNWLELIYLGKEGAPDSMGFTVNFYSQSGELVDSRRVELESLREQDSAAGHQLTDGNGKVKQAVYLVEVIPDDPEKEYLMSVTRYSSNAPAGVNPETYNYAVVAPGRAGAEGDLFTSISSREYLCGRSQNWVEVANTADEEVIGDIYFRNASGQIVGTSSVTMAAKSQSHFNATAMLPDDSIGSVQIASSKEGALLAQSMVYIHDCDRNGIQTAYAASARTLGRRKQAGTGNTFLGMDNVLRLVSTSNLPVSPDFTLLTYLGESSSGKLPLTSFAAADEQLSNNASYNFPSDRYGTITVWSPEEGQFLAESLRIRRKVQDGLPRVDFLIPTEIK